MKMRRHSITIMTIFLFAHCALFAQVRKQTNYDRAPDQLAVTFLETVDDYSLQVTSSTLQRTRLSGAEVEYASRHFYPWEVVGTAQYSEGHPLGQRLLLAEAGAGYCRSFKQWTPFGRIVGGVSRTSSGDLMYLYTAPKWGLASTMSAGLDVQLSPRWGIRGVQVQNEYLPYGSRGSVYWSIGAGITYRIRP
jgi:hypothetical protein